MKNLFKKLFKKEEKVVEIPAPKTKKVVKKSNVVANKTATKECTKCGKEKPESYFYNTPKGNKRSQCKECAIEYGKKQYSKNVSATKAKNRPKATPRTTKPTTEAQPTKRK